MKRIAGFGLNALLNDDNSVTFFGSHGDQIVTVKDVGARVLAQFKTKTNYRAGQHSDSKMATILECMMDVPELEEYL